MKELLFAALMAQESACMEEALYFEARGEGYAGMVHVAAVVHNRVLDDRWPDTICGVVRQPRQFSYIDTLPSLSMTDKGAVRAAEGVTEMTLTSNGRPLLGNILYYHADYVRPNWHFHKLEEYATVNRHIFYTDKE